MASINTKVWVETTIQNLLNVVKPKIVSLEGHVVNSVNVVDGKVQLTKQDGSVLSSTVIPLTPIATAEVLATGTSESDAISVKQFVDGQAAQDAILVSHQNQLNGQQESISANIANIDEITKAGGTIDTKLTTQITPLMDEISLNRTAINDIVKAGGTIDAKVSDQVNPLLDMVTVNGTAIADITKSGGTIDTKVADQVAPLMDGITLNGAAINDITKAGGTIDTKLTTQITPLMDEISLNGTAINDVVKDGGTIDVKVAGANAYTDTAIADVNSTLDTVSSLAASANKAIGIIEGTQEDQDVLIEANRVKGNANAADIVADRARLTDLEAAAASDKEDNSAAIAAVDNKTVTGVNFANNELVLTQKDGSELKTGINLDYRIKYVVDYVADLPDATENANIWAVVRKDTEGLDDNGIYLSNGTEWSFALAIPNGITLEGQQHTVTTAKDLPRAEISNGDYGTVVRDRATSYYKSNGSAWNLIKTVSMSNIIADDITFGEGGEGSDASVRAVSVAQLASLFTTSTTIEEMQVIYDNAYILDPANT